MVKSIYSNSSEEHNCYNINELKVSHYMQNGVGIGENVLIVGESLANNGWRKSGRAFYNPEGKLLPSGKNLNKLIQRLDLRIETCGFTELIKCYVGSRRKLLISCGKKCWPFFLKQLQSKNYILIILLGVKTLEIFNNQTNYSLKEGLLYHKYIGSKKYYILPIFHPSPINPYNYSKNETIFNSYQKILSDIIKAT